MFLTSQGVDDIKKMVVSESKKVHASVPSERRSVVALCEKVADTASQVKTTEKKLRELKEEALKSLRENVKVKKLTVDFDNRPLSRFLLKGLFKDLPGSMSVILVIDITSLIGKPV